MNLAETQPIKACDFLFEGLYVLIEVIPRMCRVVFVRSALFAFAELLETLDRYYYAAVVFDAYLLLDPADTSYSASMGEICNKNRDSARAVVHLSQAITGGWSTGRFDEVLYLTQMVTNIYNEHGLWPDSMGLLAHVLNRTYSIPVAVRATNIGESTEGSLQPTRIRKASSSMITPSPDQVMTLGSGISLVESFLKNNHFALAIGLLNEMRRSTENPLFLALIELLTAKYFLGQNQFALFLTSLPELNLRRPRKGSTNRNLFFQPSPFDLSLAAVKLLSRALLERNMYREALFWTEVAINVLPPGSSRDLGYYHFRRGMALLIAVYRSSGAPVVDVHEPLTPLMSSVGKYEKHGRYKQRRLLEEALASLRFAMTQFDRAGCFMRLSQATAAYIELILYHFLRTGDRGLVHPLTIREPMLTVVNMEPVNLRRSSSFSDITIDLGSVVDQLSPVHQRLENAVARTLDPLAVIGCELLSVKLHILQDEIAAAESAFGFAFANLRRYFMCGPLFIARDFPLRILNEMESILMNGAHCVTLFESSFINAHLIVFDWLADVQAVIANRLRSPVADCQDPVEAGITPKWATLKRIANPKFPDFFDTLDRSKLVHSKPAKGTSRGTTIPQQLRFLRANIRLSERGKLLDDEMQIANRTIVRQIETIADAYRRAHPSRVPSDINYSSIAQASPRSAGVVFVEHLFDAIYVYVPRTGLIRKVAFTWTKQSFSLAAHRTEFQFATQSSLFNAEFYALVAQLVLCDRKHKPKSSHKMKTAPQVCAAARESLFGSIGSDFVARPAVPDRPEFTLRKGSVSGWRGHLHSIAVSQDPVIFVTSADLRGLPFELMFPSVLVLRALSFVQLALAPKLKQQNLKVIICRQKGESKMLRQNAIRRSHESIRLFLQGCGAGEMVVPFVSPFGRNFPVPFPLFSSKKDTSVYRGKYPFCEFFDLSPGRSPQLPTALYIFTYSDLCEMSTTVHELTILYPMAFFMFIPAPFVRDALKTLGPIMERHQQRAKFLQQPSPQGEPGVLKLHLALIQVPYTFVTALQGTLIEMLGCPIVVLGPIH
jgi:tetratricopeptide (TPR) repeat protein